MQVVLGLLVLLICCLEEVKGLVNITSLSSSLGPLLKVLSPTSPSGSPQHYILRTHGSEQSPRSIMSRYSKGQQVVVRYMDDGFYYPGECSNILVLFPFGQKLRSYSTLNLSAG